MTGSTFGTLFKVATFGESHGPALGCVVDGVPPGIALSEADIQPYLDKRKPGTSKFTTQRREADEVQILSGVFEGKTTGTPIGLLIHNTDQRSKDYSEIKDKYRPGHADYTYDAKYGFRDYRGGGRSSARETAMRVAAGAVARKVLQHLCGKKLVIQGCLVQMGVHAIERKRFSWKQVDQNPFFCPDAQTATLWENYLNDVRKRGSSVGAVIEIQAKGLPAGLGAPVFDRLDADVAKALMSIPAVKGVEIGEGMRAAELEGPENADEMAPGKSKTPKFLANHAGGTLGGISTGEPLVARFAVKPTSSITIPRKTVTTSGQATEIITKGRHDPCVGIRAVPIGEAMVALVLADHLLRQRAQCGF